jgi:hypothetical protein
LFNGQTPQPLSITKQMPSNTICFLNLSFNDFALLHNSYKSYLESNSLLESYNETINNINEKFNINTEQSFLPWIDNELAFIVTDPGKNKISSTSFVVIKVTNIETAKNKLDSLSECIHNITNTKPFSEKYYDNIIKQIDIPGILSALLGKQFEGVKSNFYAFYDNYVIFANNIPSLKQYLYKVKIGKTLTRNKNYIEFSDNISERSNIYFYCNIRRSLNLIGSNFCIGTSRFIKNNSSLFSNFDAFSVQFSSNSGLFYTNIYLKYNPFYEEEKSSAWELDLDSKITGKPFLVKDHTDNSTKIVAFDENKNIYLISLEGEIIWKITLNENIISDVYQVDYYKNGKIQYLFNTKNYICIIDLKGNNLSGYPLKLPAEATNGLALFDYNNKKDYRILVACSNNIVYNFDIKGSKVKGWRMNKTSGKVSVPVKHINISKKDYIITPEDNGRIHITNRKGINRIKAVKNSNNCLNSELYINKTNSRGLFLTTNNNGELIYITKSGKIKKSKFGNFSKDHFFLYEDINNDGSNDFIFLDKNQLTVFNRFKKVILDHKFDNNINIRPQFIKLNNLKLIHYSTFMLNLNQLIVLKKR